MASINSVLTYNANLSPAQAQLKALTGQVGALTAAFNTLDKSAVRAQGALASTFLANVGQIGGFTTQMVQSGTAVDNFGKALSKQRLTMRQYFREAIAGYTKQNSMMKQLAAQQVRMQQSMMVPMGVGPGGTGRAAVLTPTSVGAMGTAAAMASQKFSIFNELVRGGSERLLNFGKNTQWTGRQLMVGFTLPLVMFTALVSKQFREIDKELTRFSKVYGADLVDTVENSTAKMREQVKELAYEISSAYGIAAKETAALAADIAQTGKEGEDLIASVKQTTRLAVLGEVERQEAMRATLSIQNAFKLSTDELTESIDFLNAVENQTSTTLQDLAGAIPRVGPVIQSLGGDIKDMSLLLVAMREGGVSAGEAANALKSGLGRLINPTKRARDVAASFGVSLEDIIQSSRGQLIPMIFGLQDALQGLDDFARAQVLEKVFGKYQFARMSALFANLRRQGSQTLSVMELAGASTTELAGIANKELRELQESSAMRFQRTIENLKNSLIPLGNMLTETLIPVLSGIGSGIKSVMEFFQGLPGPIKNFSKYVIALTAMAGPVVMLVGLFGNLIANTIKFGMLIVRMGAKVAGLRFEKFELLTADVIAARSGVDNLTTSFVSQETALKRLNTVMATYAGSLAHLMKTNPALFTPGALGAAGKFTPAVVRRQRGSTSPERVPGGYGGGDKIPALLEPGEFVIRKEAARKYAPVLTRMNKGDLPGFSNGGSTSSNTPPTAPTRRQLSHLLDPVEVDPRLLDSGDHLTSSKKKRYQREIIASELGLNASDRQVHAEWSRRNRGGTLPALPDRANIYTNLVLDFPEDINQRLKTAAGVPASVLARAIRDENAWKPFMARTGLTWDETRIFANEFAGNVSRTRRPVSEHPNSQNRLHDITQRSLHGRSVASRAALILANQWANVQLGRHRYDLANLGGATPYTQWGRSGPGRGFRVARGPLVPSTFSPYSYSNIPEGMRAPVGSGPRPSFMFSVRGARPGPVNRINFQPGEVITQPGMYADNGAMINKDGSVTPLKVNPFTAAMEREAQKQRIFPSSGRMLTVEQFDKTMKQISSQAGKSYSVNARGPAATISEGRQTAQQQPQMMKGMGLMNIAFASSMLVGSMSMAGGASNDLAMKLGILSGAVMGAAAMMQMFSGKKVVGNFMGMGTLGAKMQARGVGPASNLATGATSKGSALFRAGGAVSMLGGPLGIGAAALAAGGIGAFMLYKKAAEEARERAIAAFADPTKTAEYFGEVISNTVDTMKDLNSQVEGAEEIDKGLREAVKTDYSKLIEKIKYGGAETGARELSIAFNKMLAMGLSSEKAEEAIKAIALEAGQNGGEALASAMRKGMLAEKTPEQIARQLPRMFGAQNNAAAIEMAQKTLETLEKTSVSAFERNIAEALDNVVGDVLSTVASATMNLIDVSRWGGNAPRAGSGVIERAYDKDELRRQIKQNADASRAIEQQQAMINEMMNVSADQIVELSKTLFETFKEAPEESIKAFDEIINITKQNVDTAFDAGAVKDFITQIDPLGAVLLNSLIGDDRQISLAVMKAIASGMTVQEIIDAMNKGGIPELDVEVNLNVREQKIKNEINELKQELQEDLIVTLDIQIEDSEENLESYKKTLENLDERLDKFDRKGQKRVNVENRQSQRQIDSMENQIDLIQERAEARREEFDATVESLQQEKERIDESTDAYINSIQKRQRADDFYANQRKTAFSALQKLASGDVFGFLQEREQMSQDAQQFAYDEQIKGIEEARDREIKSIDDTIDEERKRQEEYEKNAQDRIDLINDEISAEQDRMEQRQKDHDREVRMLKRRQRDRRTDLQAKINEEQVNSDRLRAVRRLAEAGELQASKDLAEALGENLAKPYIEKQKEILKTAMVEKFVQLQSEFPEKSVSEIQSLAYYELIDIFNAVFGVAGRINDMFMRLEDIGFNTSTPQGSQYGGPSGSGSSAGEGSTDDNTTPTNVPDPNFKNGGKVSGPGTPTSDSIPARLSNGEYVVRASSVQKYGKPMMDEINAARFAVGGYVSADRAEREAQSRYPVQTGARVYTNTSPSGPTYQDIYGKNENNSSVLGNLLKASSPLMAVAAKFVAEQLRSNSQARDERSIAQSLNAIRMLDRDNRYRHHGVNAIWGSPTSYYMNLDRISQSLLGIVSEGMLPTKPGNMWYPPGSNLSGRWGIRGYYPGVKGFALGGYVSADRLERTSQNYKPIYPLSLADRAEYASQNYKPVMPTADTLERRSMRTGSNLPLSVADRMSMYESAPGVWKRASANQEEFSLVEDLINMMRTEFASFISITNPLAMGLNYATSGGFGSSIAGMSAEEWNARSLKDNLIDAAWFGTNFLPIPGWHAAKAGIGAARAGTRVARAAGSSRVGSGWQGIKAGTSAARNSARDSLVAAAAAARRGVGSLVRPRTVAHAMAPESSIDFAMDMHSQGVRAPSSTSRAVPIVPASERQSGLVIITGNADPNFLSSTLGTPVPGLGSYGVSPGGYFQTPSGLVYAKTPYAPSSFQSSLDAAYVEAMSGYLQSILTGGRAVAPGLLRVGPTSTPWMQGGRTGVFNPGELVVTSKIQDDLIDISSFGYDNIPPDLYRNLLKDAPVDTLIDNTDLHLKNLLFVKDKNGNIIPLRFDFGSNLFHKTGSGLTAPSTEPIIRFPHAARTEYETNPMRVINDYLGLRNTVEEMGGIGSILNPWFDAQRTNLGIFPNNPDKIIDILNARLYANPGPDDPLRPLFPRNARGETVIPMNSLSSPQTWEEYLGLPKGVELSDAERAIREYLLGLPARRTGGNINLTNLSGNRTVGRAIDNFISNFLYPIEGIPVTRNIFVSPRATLDRVKNNMKRDYVVGSGTIEEEKLINFMFPDRPKNSIITKTEMEKALDRLIKEYQGGWDNPEGRLQVNTGKNFLDLLSTMAHERGHAIDFGIGHSGYLNSVPASYQNIPYGRFEAMAEGSRIGLMSKLYATSGLGRPSPGIVRPYGDPRYRSSGYGASPLFKATFAYHSAKNAFNKNSPFYWGEGLSRIQKAMAIAKLYRNVGASVFEYPIPAMFDKVIVPKINASREAKGKNLLTKEEIDALRFYYNSGIIGVGGLGGGIGAGLGILNLMNNDSSSEPRFKFAQGGFVGKALPKYVSGVQLPGPLPEPPPPASGGSPSGDQDSYPTAPPTGTEMPWNPDPSSASSDKMQSILKKWLGPKLQLYSGWSGYGSWPGGVPRGIMMHHWAGTGEGGFQWMARHPEAGGPIVQSVVRRDGRAQIIAYGGVGWGAGTGDARAAPIWQQGEYSELQRDLENIGTASNILWQVEVESEGKYPDFTPTMFDTIAKMSAGIREFSGWPSFSGRIINHKDWAYTRGKPDTLYPASLYVTNAQNAWSRGPQYLASGGFVSGPGGPIADKIPAMLSNGEYVVRASSVDKYGKGMLDQINAGQFGAGSVAGFSGGGMVGGYNMGGMVSPTFSIPSNNISMGGTSVAAVRNNENFSSNNNVKIVINGANGNAEAIANRVVRMINQSNNRRNHSRSTV